MDIILIAAIAKNDVIGDRGRIPWNEPADMKHFKKTTMGSPVIMGSHTWRSLRYPLTGRLNIVISNDSSCNYDIHDYSSEEQVVSIEKAIEAAKAYNKCFIIGGAITYKHALPLCTHMILSKLSYDTAGDTYMPAINYDEWTPTKVINHASFNIEYYKRR